MAHRKEEVTYGAAQAKISEDESLRVAYKHGTPLEGGKIAESEPVSLFSSPRGSPRRTLHLSLPPEAG
ncbi:unnamed protein product [Spirodela intermedia]|uniref:Uncharacterized protein n=1 Tax=Spirodela intermedia TaxID=51605 RepID=A0A7I8IR72_SPIIN|nr:unnamed protein product [Spirodela intermedia]CAA6660452.1 unnamed protein product [Spirodela intermedia]